jgi:hypothetical protein
VTTLLPRPSLGTPEAAPATPRTFDALLRCRPVCPAAPSDPPITPETLALMPTDEAHAAVAALAPTQRVIQAIAQAAWLADFGYPVDHAEILASWQVGSIGAA